MNNMSQISQPIDFILILSCGRSGSTLLQRVLNTIEGYNICGENYGAIEDLLLFYHKLKYSDRFIPRIENKELTYQECINKEIKPCWYNTFDLSLIKNQIRNIILNMFNPLNEIDTLVEAINLFTEKRKYRVVGFKEIRFGMYDPYAKGELFEKLSVFSRDKEGLEIILDLLEELFPQDNEGYGGLRIIVNTRNVDDISKSGWWKGLESKKDIFLQQNLLISCTRKRKNVYIIDYSDVSKNNLEGLFTWLNEPYDKDTIQKVLNVKL